MNFHIGRLTFRRLPAHSFAHEDCFTTIPNAAKTASKMFSDVHLPHFFTKFVVAVISFTANFHSMSFFFLHSFVVFILLFLKLEVSFYAINHSEYSITTKN